MEQKGKSGNLIIVIMVIAAIFLFSVVIAGFIIWGGINSNKASNDSKIVEATIPKDSDLAKIDLFDSDTYFNLKNDNPDNVSYVPLITVRAEIKYFLKLKNSSIKDTKAKIESYLGEIQELISLYLKDLTPMKARDMQEQAGEDLKSQINALLNKNEEGNQDVVYKFTFTKWVIT